MKVLGFDRLFQFVGWTIQSISASESVVQVNIRRDRRRRLECPHCGKTMGRSGENPRVVQDIPAFGATLVLIQYEAIQGRCSACGCCKTFHPPGVVNGARATRRLKEYVSRLCRFMPACHVPEFVTISDETARRWDKKILEERFGEVSFDNLRYLLVDEKAIGRGHRYATIVLNGETGELLYMARGKKKETLAAFYKGLSDDQRAGIVGVCTDRSGSYVEATKEFCPDAEIIFDKFHIVMNLNRAVDDVRREEVRRLGKEASKSIKGMRYYLLKHEENLRNRQTVRLEEVLSENETLSKTHFLKEAFRALWTYKRVGWARRYLDCWIQWAHESEIGPLIRFARSLKRGESSILAYFKHRLTNGPMEAFNSVIGRVIYKCCGIKDLRYLFLKMRQESLTSNT